MDLKDYDLKDYYNVTSSASGNYYDYIPEVMPCSRCGNLTKAPVKPQSYPISSSSTTGAHTPFTVYTFVYCDACMRWVKRKRWIRIRDDVKEYGAWEKKIKGGLNERKNITREL
jgi:hypothetical protein